jgi:predicted permease
MLHILLPMVALIATGAVWRSLRPGGLDADTLRRALTTLVWYALLPALVLDVLWPAALGRSTILIAAVAAGSVVLGMAGAALSCRLCGQSRGTTGAMILAAGFPNATYLGLPVLEQSLGAWARGVAIQFDLFACTPLLFTLGIALAQRFGQGGGGTSPVRGLLRVPPLWAAGLALLLNLAQVPMPPLVDHVLQLMSRAVVPLMLIAIGLALSWERGTWKRLSAVAPVLLLRLVAVPTVALGVTALLGLSGDLRMAVVLETAMPSMVLGVVICERYGLDTATYSAAVTLSTLASLISLPLWFALLNAPSTLGL